MFSFFRTLKAPLQKKTWLPFLHLRTSVDRIFNSTWRNLIFGRNELSKVFRKSISNTGCHRSVWRPGCRQLRSPRFCSEHRAKATLLYEIVPNGINPRWICQSSLDIFDFLSMPLSLSLSLVLSLSPPLSLPFSLQRPPVAVARPVTQSGRFSQSNLDGHSRHTAYILIKTIIPRTAPKAIILAPYYVSLSHDSCHTAGILMMTNISRPHQKQRTCAILRTFVTDARHAVYMLVMIFTFGTMHKVTRLPNNVT